MPKTSFGVPCGALALALALLAGACAETETGLTANPGEEILNGYRWMNQPRSVAQAREDARDTFSRENSCPTERVAVVPRPELRWKPRPTTPLPEAYGTPEMQAKLAEMKRAEEMPWMPPADIAADPGRLEVWKSTHRAELVVHDMEADRLRMQPSFVSSEGCGFHAVYYCRALYKHPERAACEIAPSDKIEVRPALGS
jgi:hypothetical protein